MRQVPVRDTHMPKDVSEVLACEAWQYARKALYASVTSGSLLLAGGCMSRPGSEGDAVVETSMSDPVESERTEMVEEAYHADNDIAMHVRSMADAINVGEPLDSTDYNFSGVFTDGMGTPLFTDYEGVPGQWKVDVLSPREVRIRNIGVGDLFPDSLVEYLAQTLSADESEDIELREVTVYDEGDMRVEEYRYGHTLLRIETRPEQMSTGEVGPKLEITLRADTLTTNTDKGEHI